MANENVIGKEVFAGMVEEKAGLSKKDVETAIDALVEVVTEYVKEGKEIRLMGFGTFKKAHTEARNGRNPCTGETIEIAASDRLAFKRGVKY